MRTIILCLAMVSSVFANPTVNNIRVSQRENTKLVDILYDVYFIGGDTVSIGCEVSTNAGVSFDIPVTNFTGNGYGAIVDTGADRLIVWNAGIDWDENYSEQMKVRITATPARFIDNGDDTVTDNQTGLMWKNQADPVAMTFADAVIKVAEYGEGWRIPTFDEWKALSNAPTTSGLPIGHPFIITSGIYWSSDVDKLIVTTGQIYFTRKGFSFYSDGTDVSGLTSINPYLIPHIRVVDSDALSLLAVKDID